MEESQRWIKEFAENVVGEIGLRQIASYLQIREAKSSDSKLGLKEDFIEEAMLEVELKDPHFRGSGLHEEDIQRVVHQFDLQYMKDSTDIVKH